MAKSTETRTREEIMRVLDELGGKTVGDNSLVFQGDKFILPAQYEGKVKDAAKYLNNWSEQQDALYQFKRTFPYRPYDGANAFQLTMQKVFGTTGLGAGSGMFGKTPPEMISIQTGPDTTTQVAWGNVEFPPLEATFTLNQEPSDNGPLFVVYVSAPRKHSKRIQGFFDKVEETLRTSSIYKGKAITAGDVPTFIDPYRIDPRRVVYTRDVETQLNANLWALLEYSNEMRANKLPLKRHVLLEGPFGTGKSLAGLLTAQRGTENGWTYIVVSPQDNLMLAMKTAQLYAPAVVLFEDVDTLRGKVDISTLLDALDGVTNKGSEIIAIFTSNYPERIPKGVMRPGRIDAVIHIAELDAEAFERLVRTVIPEHLLGEVDFVQVGESYHGFLPAFAVEATERALRYSIARNHGKPDAVSTDDLTAAANGLRRQLALMDDAEEGAGRMTLDEQMKHLVEDVVNSTELVDSPTTDYRLKVNGKK